MADAAAPPEEADATMGSPAFRRLLAVVAVIGVVVSLVAWCFLELVHQLQVLLFTNLPDALGHPDGPPLWWWPPVLAVGGLITALAITRLPGNGGHVPSEGLAAAGGPARPAELPGIVLAGIATIGFGLVLGPEAPLIALGGGVAVAVMGMARRDTPPEALAVVGAAGGFAALSFIFTSPLVAAVILIEATAIGGSRMRVVLVPGLLAAGIGSLVSIGMGSFTGLSSSAYALGPLDLPALARPTAAEFGWTILFAAVVGAVTGLLVAGGRATHRVAAPRLLWVAPAVGAIVAGLAIAFSQTTDKGVEEVLFSGQDALPGLVQGAGTWSTSALLLLILFKGGAYMLCLGSLRGGPTFPALFLGAAAGVLAAKLPGYALTPAVAVGMGAAAVAVLRLPLSAVVLATLLTIHDGAGAEPLIIVGVVVAYLVTLRPVTR